MPKTRRLRDMSVRVYETKGLAIVKLALVTLVLLSGMAIGYGLHQPAGASITPLAEVQIQEVEVRVPEYVFVPVETIRLVEVEKVVTVIKEVPPAYKPWKDQKEFEDWFNSRMMLVADPAADCDDWAQNVAIEAMQEGRLVSPAPVYAGYFYGQYLPWLGGQVQHLGLFGMGENSMWYAEPYPPPNFKIRSLGIRDYTGK